MRDHTVEISDKAGHVFRMSIQRPNVFGKLKDALAGDWVGPEATMTGIPSGSTRRFIKQTPGNWRVLEHGFIRYSSGKVLSNNTGADASTRDIFLLNMDGTWGTQLWDYEDALGVNDQGQGSITQPWVMGFLPGKFSWVLID
jgi:hypothetical protein